MVPSPWLGLAAEFARPAYTRRTAEDKSSSRILCLKPALCPAQSEFDQDVEQLAVRDARVLEHFGIHADGGEARNGVDLVDVDLAGWGFHQEIDTRHSF